MNVFISWSGDRSKKLAEALSQFLSGIFPDLKVWMSGQDIEAGSRWADELNRILESSHFGVLCLTPENLYAPWLLFESGSLAKSVSRSRVVPYRLGLSPEEIPLPLAQFQGVNADDSGTWNLLHSLNSTLESSLGETKLRRAFERQWLPLKSQMDALLASANAVAASEILREGRRARGFCERIAGAWWERIAGDGLGFFHVQLDELHNTVRLAEGRFYDEEGNLTAYWNSAVARIDEEISKKGIVYLRECRHPTGEAKNWFHGYGDMWFDGSTETSSQGYGTFYDLRQDDPQKTLVKTVELRRVMDPDEVGTMQNGSASDRKALVLRTIEAW